MQGYVSSRRRRQRRIAELVTLVEQLEQYLTILRSESSNLQNDIQSLGELMTNLVDMLAYNIAHGMSSKDCPSIANATQRG